MKSRRLLALAILLGPLLVAAQVQTGLPPFGSFSGGPDVTNLGNLNVHFADPIFAKAGRGVPFNYGLSFDSSVWYPSGGAWTPVTNWGWRGPSDAFTGWISVSTQTHHCIDPNTGFRVNYYGHTFGPFHDGFGVVHPVLAGELDASTVCGVDQVLSPGTATDGSGYTLNPTGGSSVQVIAPSGRVILPTTSVGFGSGTVIDTNGNMISATSGTFTDTLGMTVLTATGGAPNPLVFTYTDSSGASRSVTVNYSPFTVKTNFGCAGISEYGPTSASLVSSIAYPDGSSVSFTYEPTPGYGGDVTGRVQSITLRTGATITYTYSGGNNGIECADGSAAGFSRATSDGTTTYARSGSGSAWTTTFTDASTPGNQTAINFQTAGSPANFYETHRTAYQGTSTVLGQTDTCYNGFAPPCSNTAITLPFTVIRTYLTLNNNQQSLTGVNLNSFGLPTEVDQYDFGSGAPGALLRKTLTTYASLGNIVDHPASVIVQDGGGTQIAKTTFGYDETTPTSTSGVPQHSGASGARGNLTSVNRWLNTTNSNLTITLTYDDTGNVLTRTDPGGHQTQFSYADNFADGVNRNSLAYVTQVTLPDTNSPNLAHHITKAQYDANTGLPVKTWDQNNQQTATTYDAMLRPLQVSFPDGGNTSFIYWNPNQTDVQRKITGSTNTYSATLLDSYGRVSRVARVNGESNPWDQQDFCYDSNGRLNFQSYAYQGSGWSTTKVCSGAGDTLAYDALGRTTSVTHSDGASVLTTYSGRALQVQDEGNGSGTRVTHVYQQDALRRTVTACELASSIFGIQTMPTCGLDLAGNSNGVTTSYSYDALGNVTQISQGALIARQMTYDSLGHLLTEKIPEAGGTTTSYAYNSDGLLTSRTRPSANQAVSCIGLGNCATSTTNYTYDQLHLAWDRKLRRRSVGEHTQFV